jgi:hypothetical protein
VSSKLFFSFSGSFLDKKWLTKTLESVHPDEVRKTRTKMSSRQDGGNVDNSNSDDVDDMYVSYDCELNLSTNLESTSFKYVVSHDEWKEAMQKEYDSHQDWDLGFGGSCIWNQTDRLQVGI